MRNTQFAVWLLVVFLTPGVITESLCGAQATGYGQVPLTFIANRGQAHSSVRFTAKGPGLTAYFTPAEVVLDLHKSPIRMRYVGANAAPGVDGLDLQDGHANYLIGNDPSQWRTNVPLYGRVIYKDLYPGIDMVYSSHTRLLKSEFIVAPGSDPAQIRITYEGAESVRVDDRGALVLTTSDGAANEAAPEIYQESGQGREPVKGAFRVSGNTVWFWVGDYDRSRPLRIDPVLSYSTYLGGGQTNEANAIAVDGSGAAYITGCTNALNFPVTAGAARTTAGGDLDAFVTKLNSTGSAIVYSTYLGGQQDDCGSSIAVDGAGNTYVTGFTDSTNFPVQAALQVSSGGARDAFVTELNPAGTALIYSTYLGGSGTDRGNGIALDAAGAAYVTGSTSSNNFPVQGAFQTTLAGQTDGFVAKLNATGSAIVYSTYLGGSLDDSGASIAVDASGGAYVAGNTSSTNFPTQSAVQAFNGGAADAFVTKLSASGASLIYSSYLGGAGTESAGAGRSIAVDASGSAYMTGATASTNFPVLQPLQAGNNGGGEDAFVLKLSPAGTAFVYSTYLGGSGADHGQSLAVDSSGNAYITGDTFSTDWAVISADQPANAGGSDVFVAKLNPSGGALVESGFLGGADNDSAHEIAIDSSGNAYVTGQTLSSNFPLKGAVQSSASAASTGFVAKFTFGSLVKVAAPAFTPAAGVYSAPQSVAMSTTTAGASIRYTTDGSTPTSDLGNLYSSPIPISSTTTLKALAFKNGMADSDVSMASYSITSAAAAMFIRTDTTTQGNWKGTYGSEGAAIPNDAANYPSYVQVSSSGLNPFTWLASTADTRAPQKALTIERIASAWYSFSNMSLDINLTDGKAHQVALYLLDWTNNGRAERIDILDTITGNVLDSRVTSGFGGGQYLVWNLTGHVTVRTTLTGGPNAVVSGIFFAAATPPPPPASAVFIKSDTTTQGNWKGTYGSEGAAIPNDSSNYPGYAQVSPSGLNPFTWLASTADARAPQKAAATDRIASTWYTFSNMSLDVNLTDGKAHQVALYLLDWTNSGRAERVDILDAGTGAVLDSRSASAFGGGQYLVWNVTGHVTIRTILAGGPNAVMSGIFFAAAAPPPPPASVTFIRTDAATQGNWTAAYGAEGQAIPNDSANYPSYAQVSLSGLNPFTWLASTADARAPRKALTLDHIASAWYSFSNMSLDINLTDGKPHQAAVYLLDWTNSGRAQKIDVLDAGTGNILDSRVASSFGGGQYLVWGIAGHVTIRITPVGGPNAVLSGLFFGSAPAVRPPAISNLRVVSVTNTQAVIQFTDAANPSGCIVEVAESNSYAPLSHDVNPTLFSGSNACDRSGSIITGSGPYTVTMTLGRRTVQTASNGLNYSRSLQALTQHYIRVTHGNQAAIVASTTNIPNGNTFSDALPISPTSHAAILPSAPDIKGFSFNDPFTGAYLTRIGQDSDTSGGAGGPLAWSGGANKICSNVPVSGGYYCTLPTSSGFIKLYWINTSTGVSNFLGMLSYNSGGPAGTLYASSGEGNWDPATANVMYIINHFGGSAKQSLIKLTYTGPTSAAPANSFTSLLATDMTPGVNTLTDMLVNFTASYSIPYTQSRYPSCGLHGIQVSGGHTYALGNCLRYQQDSPGYAFVLDLGNKAALGSGGNMSVVAAGPIHACPPFRWCGTHSQYYVGDQANTVFVPQSLYGGTATGPYIVTQSGAINATATALVITGEPAAAGSGIAPDGDPTLQNIAVGDIVYWQDNGEYSQVTGKSDSTHLTIARGCHSVSNNIVCDGTNAGSHAGATMWMACRMFVQYNTDTMWWSWLNDTAMTDATGANLVVDTHQNGHQVTRNFALGPVNIVEGNGWRTGAAPGQYAQAATGQVDVSPTFAGVSGFAYGNSVQKHPSYDQINAPVSEQGWFTDQWPWSYNGRPGSAMLVAGKVNTYKFTPSVGDSFNSYKLPYFGMVGSDALSDISAPNSSLPDAPSYQLCIANAANECVIGSAKGDIYFNSPALTHFGCKQGETQPGPSVKDACIQNTSVYTQAVPQFGLLAANQTGADGGVPIYGAGLSRSLTYMIGSYRKADNGGNAHPLPDGTWITVDAELTDPGVHGNMLMVKVPPQPGSDGVDRSTFIPVPVTVTSTSGSVRASINFWYGEYGYENQQCTPRREKCNVTAATIQARPFNFVQTDSWSGQSCPASCTIMLPLLPSHVMLYQIQYLDANNTALSTGPVQIVADQFTPGSTGVSSFTVAPAGVSLTASQAQQFTAIVTGSANTGASWSINPPVGTISSGGLYTAPATIASAQSVTVTAISLADPTKSATAVIALTPAVSITVGPASVSLTVAKTQQFTATITGSGNTGVSWSINPPVGTISSGGLYTAPATISSAQYVTVTAVSLADPTKSATGVVTLSAAAAISSIRMNAGGAAYTDTLGQIWAADSGFAGASCFATGSPSWTILGTSPAPAVYQSVRYGDCTFTTAVPNGAYTVNLMFAEIGVSGAGQRIFNVALNDQVVLSNFDIVLAAGGTNLPVVKPFTVHVTNGQITVQTMMIKYGAIISGIEIVPVY